jgi:hypothetical protein
MKERKSFLLRIDPGLYTEIEAWAADDLRSVNAQVEFLLAEAVKKRGRNRQTGKDSSNSGEKGKS